MTVSRREWLIGAAGAGALSVGAGGRASGEGALNSVGGSSGVAGTRKVRTPYDFGCVGAIGNTTAERDSSVDDSVKLQTFFDHMHNPENAAKYYYDWQGCWAISRPMHFIFPFDEVSRLGRFGHLHVLPIDRQTVEAFTKDNFVLTMFGVRQHWDGVLEIGQSAQQGSVNYTNRRFHNAVRCVFCSQSKFGKLRVDSCKRDALYMDSEQTPVTLRAGTPYEITSPVRSNIGATWEDVYGRFCGTSNWSTTTSNALPVTSVSTGGAPGGTGWLPDEATFVNSQNQRSRIVLGGAGTSELAVNDWGARRIELTPANYTTVAFDSTASTIAFGTTNAQTDKLVPGMRFRVDSGLNATVPWFTVISGTGASRVITPRPTNEAATPITALYSRWFLSKIMSIPVSGTLDVYPWTHPACNSAWYSMQGRVLHITGHDSASIKIGELGGLNCGIVLGSRGLYAPHIGALLADHVEIGAEIGDNVTSSHTGLVVDHTHIEGAAVTIMQVAAGGIALFKGDSGILRVDNIHMAMARASSTDVSMPSGLMQGTSFDLGHYRIDPINRAPNSGLSYEVGPSGGGLGNHPTISKGTLEGDAGILYLKFDADIARIQGEHNKAELFWYRADGGVPTGNISAQLEDWMTIAGWAVVGGPNIAPTKSGRYLFVFRPESKTIIILKP